MTRFVASAEVPPEFTDEALRGDWAIAGPFVAGKLLTVPAAYRPAVLAEYRRRIAGVGLGEVQRGFDLWTEVLAEVTQQLEEES